MIVECGSTVEYLKKVFMDEISGPSPQISQCIRNHGFPWSRPVRLRLRPKAQRSINPSSGSLLSAQKQYEQDVYNFSRTLGLPIDGAERWVLKAREFWSEDKYDITNTEEGDDFSNSNEMLDQSSREPSPVMFSVPLVPVEHFDHAPGTSTSDGFPASASPQLGSKSAGGSTLKSKDAIEENLQIMTINELKGAEQPQQPELPYFNFYRRSEDNNTRPTTLRPSILTAESFVDSGVSHDKEISRMETAVEKEEKAAKSTAKSARKARRKAEKAAMKRAENKERQKGGHEQIANPKGQAVMTKTLEEVSKFEQLEDKDKFQQQKKKGRKRKSELERLSQPGEYLGEQRKHKRGRVENDAQDVSTRKSKTKKRSPQYSPFFLREKDVNRKVYHPVDQEPNEYIPKKKDAAIFDEAKMLVDFQTPMI